ncbi:MAG TPA: ERF family protein [bacterium]|nr:ERF family protein [bacterium]HQN73838.1 ERF family protein [bacterium]
MCIYKKLNKLRMEFISRDVKKTGYNKFANYPYFELEDILPVAVPLCSEIGLTTITSFKRNELGVYGVMRVVDIEATDKFIEIESASGMATLKACHDIQNVGAVETYHRRYLWTALLELTEHDAMEEKTESGEGENSKEEKGKKKKINTPPLTKIDAHVNAEEKKDEQPKEEQKPAEAPAKTEEPKPAEKTATDKTALYHIHFMKQLGKSGQVKDALNWIRREYHKETTELTVTEMKQILAQMQEFLPSVIFEI